MSAIIGHFIVDKTRGERTVRNTGPEENFPSSTKKFVNVPKKFSTCPKWFQPAHVGKMGGLVIF